MNVLRLAVQMMGLVFCLQAAAFEQSACPAPDTHQVIPGTNLFNQQQQVYLGDAIDASLRQDYVIYTDPAVTARMQAIVDHMAQALPSSQPRFQVALVDLSEANAFSTVGGRIYVGRKLVAQSRSEDELAGVLAHEMGHLVSQHLAIEISDGFQVVLGVKQVGDQKDVIDKWNEFLSNRRRVQASGGDVHRAAKLSQAAEVQADSVSIYLVTRGGYSPHAGADFFDRITETKGNTGGFWSDFFGKTSPDSKRLREMLRKAAPMDPSCVKRRPGSATDYVAWRAAIVEFTPMRNAEVLPGLINKKALAQRLTPTINAVHVSPDGKYVIAQDDSGIFVLTRQPLKSLFRIPAWDAAPALFTPDSASVVYSIGGFGESPRVEKWNLASQKRTEVHEIHVGKGCFNPSLSPDGKTLVCVVDASSENNFRLDLVLFDTSSGTEYWRVANWWTPGILTGGYWQSWSLVAGGEREFAAMLPIRFSPDSRYLVAHGLTNSFCMDLASRSQVALPQKLKSLMTENVFTFLGSDRFIGLRDDRSGKAQVVKFPSGQMVVDEVMIGSATPSAVSHGDYLLVRPLQKSPVGLIDLGSKKLLVSGRLSGMDVWDNSCIAETSDGSIESFDLVANKSLEKIRLPQAPLAKLTTGAASSDLTWLAMSQRTRGGVWNLQTNQQVYKVMGFSGVYFDSNTGVYADFYKLPDAQRTVGLMSLPTPHFERKQAFDDKVKVRQYGKYLLEFVSNHHNFGDDDVTIEVHDIRDDKLLWSKRFSQGRPDGWITAQSHALVLLWPAGSKAIKSLAKEDADAAAKLKAFHDKEGIVFVQALDLETGKSLATAVLDTGKNSFAAKAASVSSSRLIVLDDQNRVFVYSFDGKRLGSVPGHEYDFAGDWLLVDEESLSEKLALYDLSKLERQAQYVFDSPVIADEFSGDGKRILVVSADQNVYLLDATLARQPANVPVKEQ